MIVHPIGMMRANAASGVSFTDTFAYTDETQLSTLPDYEVIDETGGSIVARGGVATTATSVGGDTLLYDGATVTADQYAEVTIGAPGSDYGDIGALMVRATDMNNRVLLDISSGATKSLRKIVSGASTSWGNTNTALVTGDVVRIEVSGNDIVVKRNGTTIFTITDDADLGGTLATGQPGFFLQSITAGWTTGVTFDQFKCGDL